MYETYALASSWGCPKTKLRRESEKRDISILKWTQSREFRRTGSLRVVPVRFPKVLPEHLPKISPSMFRLPFGYLRRHPPVGIGEHLTITLNSVRKVLVTWGQEGQDEGASGSTTVCGCVEGEDKFPKDTKEEVKKEIMVKDHSAILLSVTDEVLREVIDQTTASELWDKLTIISVNDVKDAHLSKELKRKVSGDEGYGSDLFAGRGRSHERNNGNERSCSKSRNFGKVKCYHCKEKGNIKGIVHRKRDIQRFVPGLKKNLISLGTLANNGLKYHGEGEWVKVSKGGSDEGNNAAWDLFFAGHLSDRNGGGIQSSDKRDDRTNLWHRRLGHMSEQGLSVLSKQGLLGGDVIERMNQTLMARTRCMRIFAGLSKQFWAEEVNTTSYLVNRSPSTAIGLKTPQEESKAINCGVQKSRGFESFAGTKDCGADQKVEFDTPDRVVIKEEKQEKNNTDQPEQPEQVCPYLDIDSVAYALAVGDDIGSDDPKTYKEVVAIKDAENWIIVMNEEMQSLEKKKTWDLVTLLKGDKLVGCKWVLKRKEGIPAMMGAFNLELEQLDVKTAFLHGNLEERIYISQPEGFNNFGRDHICLLNKSLYGLKQSLRQWYKRFDSFMLSNGYIQNQFDNYVYSKKVSEDSYVYLMLYVDDMLIAAKNMAVINDLKALLKSEFEIKDLGAAKKILGTYKEVKYIKTVPYSSAVGSLMYATAVKWILRYLKCGSNICLVYDGKDYGDGLVGYADSDYGGRPFLPWKVNANLIAPKWICVYPCAKQWRGRSDGSDKETKCSTWDAGNWWESNLEVEKPALFCDSQSALSLAKNPVYHERTKHIDMRLNFIRDVLEEDMFSIQKIATEHNPTDMLTKALPTEKFEHYLNLVNILRRCQKGSCDMVCAGVRQFPL
nr:retrovirus-related Pol polyprotein from transposon TNT 1-94 [Tanacetum cinerariifolium]